MKKLLIPLLLATTLATGSIYAADDISMTPPAPVNNKMLDSMVGTWKGSSEMMGKKMNDTVTIDWTLNHQFLVMKLQSSEVNNPDNHYEGMGMFGVDKNGTVKSWWFDNWGAATVATGTGKTENNQLVLSDKNAMFQEKRSFAVNGNEMVMKAKGSMKMNGKNMPFEQTVVYKR